MYFDDITYIDTKKKFWDEYTAFFKGIYEDGVLDGKTIGRHEGRNEAKEEGQKEIALNMLTFGLSVDEVSKMTGIAIEKIQSWCPERLT